MFNKYKKKLNKNYDLAVDYKYTFDLNLKNNSYEND